MSVLQSGNIYQSVKVLVDSFYRNNPNGNANITDFTYTLDKAVSRVSRIYVESAQIPFTYYTTNNTNRDLTIEYNAVTYVASISPGNYNSGTISTAIKQALDALLIVGVTWVVGFNPTTFKLTITITGGVGAFKIIVGGATLTSLGPSIGFTISTASSASLISDSVMDLSGPRYLVIKSKLIGENRAYTTAVAAPVASNSIIHTVPVNTNPGGVILDVAPEPRYNILGFKTSFQNNIDFRLEDDRGNKLDLNGNNWSVQFIFELR